MSKVAIVSDSSKLTKQLAAEFVSSAVKNRKGPHVFLLKGDLGAGKTTFALGVLAHFGIRPKAASPTFVLAKHYRPKTKNKKQKIRDIWHIDAYRLRSKEDLELVIPDLIRNPSADSLYLIEWPDQVKLPAPKGAHLISFSHGSHEKERRIIFSQK
jgi:tRNA threonylcarbamoyladenosine biosynthesis protein TsaE